MVLTFVIKREAHIHQYFCWNVVFAVVTFKQGNGEMLDQLVEDVLTQLLVPSLKNKKLFVACTKYTDLR